MHRGLSSQRQVVAGFLQNDPLPGSFTGQFDHGLGQQEEQGVFAEGKRDKTHTFHAISMRASKQPCVGFSENISRSPS